MTDFAATPEAAAAWLHAHALPSQPPEVPRIGAEVEFIVRDRTTGRVPPLDGVLGEWLERVAQQFDGAITVEPGGQVEYSSPPFASASDLVDHLRDVSSWLIAHAAGSGLGLESTGIDAVTALEDVPLQLHGARYDNMHAYLSSIGEAGPRMMRQTAALQISIDPSHDPAMTWSVLNRAAPVLTALFANSRIYAGSDTGHASYRAQSWRTLDPSRTGVIGAAAATDSAKIAADYARFALDARCIFDAPAFRPFREIPGATEESWRAHLTTLFPEVRPKQYYEVRCIDALDPRWYAAPLVLVWVLCRDRDVLQAADRLLPAVTDEALRRAALAGLDDAALHDLAAALVTLVLDAGRRAGEDLAQRAHLDVLETWWGQSRRDVRRSSTTSSATIM